MNTEETTPEQLAERARRLGTDGGSEQDIIDLIRDAEAGGAEHMAAVAGQVVNWPAGGGLPSSVYDTATGRPAFHESNVLIECRIRVEGEPATFREAVDPFLWSERFGADQAEFDRYLDYALHRAFGLLMSDPRLGPRIRSKVWVVKPGDKHDFQRCHDSPSAPEWFRDPGADPMLPEAAAFPPALNPYCHDGVIVRAPGQYKVNGVPRYAPSYTPLGTCPCRCHLRDGSAVRAEQLVRVHRHFPMNWDPQAARFDEDQLPEDVDDD